MILLHTSLIEKRKEIEIVSYATYSCVCVFYITTSLHTYTKRESNFDATFFQRTKHLITK